MINSKTFVRGYKMTIEHAKEEVKAAGFRWLAMDESGELWAGDIMPDYHEIFGLWIWALSDSPVKVGWVYPLKEWRDCRWQIMR